MKKLVMFSAILIGAVTASQAGVSFNIGIHLPVPRGIVISRPAPVYEPAPAVTVVPEYETPAAVCPATAPVVVTPPICEPPAVVVAPPVCEPPVVVHSRPVVIERPVYVDRHVNYREGYGRDFRVSGRAVADYHRDYRWH